MHQEPKYQIIRYYNPNTRLFVVKLQTPAGEVKETSTFTRQHEVYRYIRQLEREGHRLAPNQGAL
jgi:hypothetical protein